MGRVWSQGGHQIIEGDALAVLRTMPEDTVHCIITSPPYWGLRDYGTGRWVGGDAECDHKKHPQPSSERPRGALTGSLSYIDAGHVNHQTICPSCGAVRIDDQIGLEPTPDLYVQRLVDVFREARRVLRPDGTCWIVVGDTWCGHWSDATAEAEGPESAAETNGGTQGFAPEARPSWDTLRATGLKPKDLVGVPALLALALRADGWWYRDDIIWAKGISGEANLKGYHGNVKPESVSDRCTKSYEHILMMTKSPRYYYDAEAIGDHFADDRQGCPQGMSSKHQAIQPGNLDDPQWNAGGFKRTRNCRAVWTVKPECNERKHYATYPGSLIERPILAGTSMHGACAICGAPWARNVERFNDDPAQPGLWHGPAPMSRTTGWAPTCDCGIEETEPCTILDPFAGSGTTLRKAHELGRRGLGIELSPEYFDIAVYDMEHLVAQGSLI